MKLKRWLAGLMCIGLMAAAPLGVVSAANSTLTGDVDDNGTVDLLDLIMLQKWVHGVGSLTASENADLNADRVVDVFDLGIMKQWLLNGIRPQYYAYDLNRNIKAGDTKGLDPDEEFELSQTKFAISLLQETAEDGRNVLISPYSVMQALSMTANGAKGNTLEEMEQALGGTSIDRLNQYLYTQRTSQPNDEKCKLLTANSIWIRDDADRIKVNEDFLQKNADYYGAAAYLAPFDDTTVRDINTWIDNNTDHMIPKMLDEIKGEEVMALVNAVTFDAKWDMPYDEYMVNDLTFTAADGTKQEAEMLCDEEHFYLEDEHATGFLKTYQGGRYAFAALLPEEGMTTKEYINTLTAEGLHKTLAEPSKESVMTQLPKFEYDYSEMLNNAFQNMGMEQAFTVDADFSDMAWTSSGILFISRILHKTHISVTEEGTRAGAATVVTMADKAMMMEPKKVYRDRPFVYCIVDRDTSLPVFIGTVETLA